MMPLLIDILLIAFTCLTVFFAYKKGFVRTVVSIVGYILAAVVAFGLSAIIAGPIFDHLIAPPVTETVQTSIDEQVDLSQLDGEQLNQQIDQIYDAMPEFLSAMMEETSDFRQELQATVGSISTQNASYEIASAIVNTGIRPVFVMLVRSVLFVILFAILMVVVGLLSRMLKTVNHIPVLGKMNAVLGGVLGVLKAAFWLYAIAVVIYIFVDLTAGQNGVINNEVIEQTYIFNIFYKYNPLLSFKL